jgi:hypothetical protein
MGRTGCTHCGRLVVYLRTSVVGGLVRSQVHSVNWMLQHTQAMSIQAILVVLGHSSSHAECEESVTS